MKTLKCLKNIAKLQRQTAFAYAIIQLLNEKIFPRTYKTLIMNRFKISLAMLAGLACATFSATAQKIYSVSAEYQADVKVFVVDQEYRADLIVYRTDKEYRAKASENKGIWFICDQPYRADKKVFFTDREYRADLKVFFTDREYRAGWRNAAKKPLLY